MVLLAAQEVVDEDTDQGSMIKGWMRIMIDADGGRVVENSIHSLNKCWEIYLQMDLHVRHSSSCFAKADPIACAELRRLVVYISVSLCTKRREFVSLLTLRLSQIGCTER